MRHACLPIINEMGAVEMALVQLYDPRSNSKTYSSGDKLVRTDTEGSNKYVVATGFHEVRDNWFVVTSDGEIVREDKFRKPNSMEFDRFSKYPDTVGLRTYLNDAHWKAEKIKNKGREKETREFYYQISSNKRFDAKHPLGPHLHVDEFTSVYGGKLNMQAIFKMQGQPIPGFNIYIDVNFRGGRYGQKQMEFDKKDYDSFFDPHPYKNFRPMCGSYLTGPFLLERPDFEFDLFHRDRYDERDPVFVKLNHDSFGWREEYLPLKLWDPVSDIVRVERICGNNTFISEFGYICNIQMYTLITGSEYTRWRLTATN